MIDMAVGSRIQKWIQKCVCKWDGETAMRNAAHLVDRHTSHAGAHSFFGRFSLPVSPINNESVASSSSRWKQPQASPRLASPHLTPLSFVADVSYSVLFQDFRYRLFPDGATWCRSPPLRSSSTVLKMAHSPSYGAGETPLIEPFRPRIASSSNSGQK